MKVCNQSSGVNMIHGCRSYGKVCQQHAASIIGSANLTGPSTADMHCLCVWSSVVHCTNRQSTPVKQGVYMLDMHKGETVCIACNSMQLRYRMHVIGLHASTMLSSCHNNVMTLHACHDVACSVTTLYAYQNVGRIWGDRQLQGS